jgi:thioesterase domain-containing protein
VAYFTARGSSNPPGPPELRGHVSARLPAHMVPAHFVVLDELPLTPNGKLDRAALPAPDDRSEFDAGYAAPRTPAEEILAEIWCDVLRLEQAGIHDDFFELGGHSLVATQVVSRSNKRGLGLAVRDVFEHPTLIALARVAEKGSAEEYDWDSPIVFNGSGDREAVMLVNPVNVTTPYWYADLARALGKRHPSFALQPLLEGRSTRRLVTIEEMAEKCIADLTELSPDGPYVVGGWSLGAVVAWHVACRLSASGRAPTALVLIDPPPPTTSGGRAEAAVRDVDAWAREVLAVLDAAPGETISDEHRRLLALLFEEGDLPEHYLDLAVSDLVRFVEGHRISAWAQDRYDVPRYEGDVVLFASGASEEAVAERVEGWKARVDGDLVVHAVEASHHALLLDPRAGALARAITDHLT